MSVAMMLGGALMGANAAEQAKKDLSKVVDLPGVDLASVYSDSLGNQQKFLPQAQQITGSINSFNSEQMNKLLESSIPGWAKLQKTRTDQTQAMLEGRMFGDDAAAIFRAANSKAIGSGTGGTQNGDFLAARNFGLGMRDIIGKGMEFSNSIIGSTPMAPLADVSGSLIGTKDVLGLRSGERSEKLSAMTNQAIAPSWSQVFGQGLTQTGSKLMDLMSSIGGSAAGGACWVAREVFGSDNPEWLFFRQWLIDCAPDWFRNLYIENGEGFALWISDKPIIKALVRSWMRGRIESWKRRDQCLSA